MRETRADTVQATLLAIALHVLLFALAWIGMWWTRSNAPQSAAGPVIEAELIDPDALSASMQQVLRQRPEPLQAAPPEPPEPEPELLPEPLPEPVASTPPPQPLPEPTPPKLQPKPQERVPEPDTREQERVSKQAVANQEAREREQEERRRQEQIELAAEQQRLAEAKRKQQETEMERQRKEQLADAKRRLAEIRRKRAANAEAIEQSSEKLARIKAAQNAAEPAPASASPPPGNEGGDPALMARYIAAISADIESNWTKPDNIPPGQSCRITIHQLPGGDVIDAMVAPDCPYDELGRRSIKTAVLKAEPLPYAGFETVFSRTLLLNFQPAR